MKKIDKYLTRLSIGVFFVISILVIDSRPFDSRVANKDYLNLIFCFYAIAILGFVILFYKAKDPLKEIVIGMYIAIGFMMLVAPAHF